MQIDMSGKQELKSAFDYEKYLIDPEEEINTPTCVLKIGNTEVFTHGNISCISGGAKSRKTFFLALLAASFLEQENENKVIIFDTEQAKFHTHKLNRRILRILGWNYKKNENLQVYFLRELSTEQRTEFIASVIIEKRPDLVFIDGVRDLVKDFNNPVESSDIVNLLMKLSSVTNCHICTILHVNKGQGNTELRGHVGTEIQNKSETIFTIEKVSEDTSVVKSKHCRNIDFADFFFKINDDGLPEFCDPNTIPENPNIKLETIFNEILPRGTALSYSMLKLCIIEKLNLQERGAEKKIKKAIENEIILKNESEKYYSTQNNKQNFKNYDLPY